MNLTVNGEPEVHPPEMLHDCRYLRSRRSSGEIFVRTARGSVSFKSSDILWPLPAESYGATRWGNPVSRGSLTRVAHVRALGGLPPERAERRLTSVALFVARNHDGRVRLAVYAGGSLEHGPGGPTPARLLYDFGMTPAGALGWVRLRHPAAGILVPPNTPLWIAWKGKDGKVSVKYQEEACFGGDFQRTRGRWESKAISPDPNVS